MTYLAYYSNEREEFKEEFKRELPNWDATVIVIEKLLRHYKLGNPNVSWTSGRNHSKGGRRTVIINIDTMNNFAVICHELAHTYQDVKGYREKGENWHNKRHKRIMARMLNYCKSKNWFEEELNRRLAPRPVKLEPTKQQIQQQKIIIAEKKIKRYEMKIKMYQKKLSKTNRSLIMLKKRCPSSLD